MNWSPLIEADKREASQRKLAEIRTSLETYQNNEPGLMGGAPGIALFWFYLGRALEDDSLSERGMAQITTACDTVEQGFAYPTFAGGLAGLGWTISHLAGQGFIDADVAEVLDDLTEPLHQHMLSFMRQGEYDYLHGALGIALYFLDRPDLPVSGEFISGLVEALILKSEADPGKGLRWESLLNRETNLMGYNLSLSHGQASIIDVLGRIVQGGYATQSAPKALTGAIEYLLANEHTQIGPLDSFFPSWVTHEPSDKKGGRLAWCYGDLGVGQALLHTGQRLGNKAWQEKGLAMLRHTLNRQDPREAGVVDAGLCHGAAGLVHIYNRLWQETHYDGFATAARHWLDCTLKQAVHEGAPAGYKAFRTPEYGGWTAEMGLLEGVAGIGLALISALYPVEPCWDRLLLLS